MIKPRFKIFADSVHGFISVPRNLLLALIHTPEVQRLRRIRQLGVGNLVYPGAEHTRFSHALGAMALMQDALTVLSEKGTPISQKEYTAALAVALLHDIGHGPFSHTLENVLIEDFQHESMSRVLIERLNEQFPGKLDLVLQIFDNTYERPFFHQLISSQLDMDRLDYLRRDSYHTGVTEGEVGVPRIIKTLRVHPLGGSKSSVVAVDAKGIYAVENFLFARRLMYWQVYLHKTVVSGDRLLASIIKRARDLLRAGNKKIGDFCSPSLLFFISNEVKGNEIEHPAIVDAYCKLDDTDINYSLKQWMHCQDPILRDLSRRFIHRSFLRVTYLEKVPTSDDLIEWHTQVTAWLTDKFSLPKEQAAKNANYYLDHGKVKHVAYRSDRDPIDVIGYDGVVRELSAVTDNAAVAALTQLVEKPYVCYPKEVNLNFEGLTIHENSDNF